MVSEITGKKIWITGAGSGIGRSLALSLACAGNHVVISGRNQDKLETVRALAPSNISTLVCDVSDDTANDAVRGDLASQVGSLDIAIFNAGHCEYVENGQLRTDLFRRVYEVNVFGVVNSAVIAIPLLRRNGKASSDPQQRSQIVGIASLSTIVGLPRAEAYGSSKASMNYLLESLRLDIANQGIDVTVVNPGFVKTPMTDVNDFPMPFLMNADTAAQRIIAGIARRKLKLQFPKRLHYTLALAASMPGLWYRRGGKMLSRAKRVTPAAES